MVEAFQLYIDGAFCDAEGGASFESLDPATGKAWAIMPKASAADTERAVRAAHEAFLQGPWPALTATARGKLLYRLADLVARDARLIAELESRDTGKVLREPAAVPGTGAEYLPYLPRLSAQI